LKVHLLSRNRGAAHRNIPSGQAFIFSISSVVSILASCGALGINDSEIAEFYLLRARDFQCNSHYSQAEEQSNIHSTIQQYTEQHSADTEAHAIAFHCIYLSAL